METDVVSVRLIRWICLLSVAVFWLAAYRAAEWAWLP